MKVNMNPFVDIKNIFTGFLVLSIFGCSGKKQPQEEIDTQLKEAARIMQQSPDISSGEADALENFKNKLNGFFPSTLPDFTSPRLAGDYNSDLGMTACRSFADYVSEDEKRSIRISVTDLGEKADQDQLPALAWRTAEINRDSLDHIERTSTYHGIRIFEQYYPDDGIGELQIILANRYILDVDGFGVSYNALRDALQKLNLEQIEKLR